MGVNFTSLEVYGQVGGTIVIQPWFFEMANCSTEQMLYRFHQHPGGWTQAVLYDKPHEPS
eukprot:scaffold54157_cov12-Tisochrysis_lutea.AAC.1